MASAADEDQAVDRLTPEMASFRLLLLAAIEEYWAANNDSPSQGELVSRLDTHRSRVRHALKSLAQDGKIILTKGHRGIRLPTVRDEAIRQLRELGWVVDEECLAVRPPGGLNPALLPPAELTYPQRHELDEKSDRRRA